MPDLINFLSILWYGIWALVFLGNIISARAACIVTSTFFFCSLCTLWPLMKPLSLASPLRLMNMVPSKRRWFAIESGYYIDLWKKLSEVVTIGPDLLERQGRLDHLIRPGLAKDDHTFKVWDAEDSKIMSWLWESMDPTISDACMFLATAKEKRDFIRLTYLMMRHN